jgi:hypothetical protein
MMMRWMPPPDLMVTVVGLARVVAMFRLVASLASVDALLRWQVCPLMKTMMMIGYRRMQVQGRRVWVVRWVRRVQVRRVQVVQVRRVQVVQVRRVQMQ